MEFQKEEYIGISEGRLHHILGVARKCYSLAKEEGFPEDFCRKMFAIGWNHDIGYEFSIRKSEHAEISYRMLNGLFASDKEIDDKTIMFSGTPLTVFCHGQVMDSYPTELRILNTADMTVDKDGNDVDVLARLEDIKERFGTDSFEYSSACQIAYDIGLTENNVLIG